MLFLFILVIVPVILYLCIPSPQVKVQKESPKVIVRNTGKIFTKVDTSTYGRVPVQNEVRYEESKTNSEELNTLKDIFGS